MSVAVTSLEAVVPQEPAVIRTSNGMHAFRPRRGPSRFGVAVATIAGDVAVLAGSGWLASSLVGATINMRLSATFVCLAIVIYVLLSIACGAYRVEALSRPTFQGHVALAMWLVACTAVGIGLYTLDLIPTDAAGEFAWRWLGTSMLVLLGFRLLMHNAVRLARDAGWLATRVAVVGTAPLADVVAAALAAKGTDTDIVLAGVIKLSGESIESSAVIAALERSAPETVVLAMPLNGAPLSFLACETLRALPLNVLVPAASLPPGSKVTHRLVGRPMVELWSRPLAGWGGFVKRTEDLVIGAVATLVAAPVMLLVAIAIRLDSRGPIFIRQLRYGLANQPVYIWKFRSMDWERSDLSGARAIVPNDDRVTRVGRILRNTSLDELPQLLNVLRGDMSLVGPRPHPVEMRVGNVYYQDAVKHYAARHRVRPGITGLAQINGCRGAVDTLEKANRRLNYDLDYVENWSPWLDLQILLRTVYKGFINNEMPAAEPLRENAGSSRP